MVEEPGGRLETTKPLTGRVIVIDPGHNGRYESSYNNRLVPAGNGQTKACNTSGTATNAGWPEHAYTWEQALALRSALTRLGARVVMTRDSDDGLGPCINERADVSNKAKADLSISIHADGNLAAGARGFHVIVSTTMVGGSSLEQASDDLAVDVREALVAGTAMPVSTYIGGGTALSPRSDIGGLNLLASTPGVMVEMGNMRDATDAALLESPQFQHAAASALADAATEFLTKEKR